MSDSTFKTFLVSGTAFIALAATQPAFAQGTGAQETQPATTPT